MRIIGILVCVACIVLGMGGSLAILIDIPSMIMVFVALIASLLMSFGSGLGSAFKAAFTSTDSVDVLRDGIAVVERGKTFAIVWGVVGTLVGKVIMLKFMDDPAAIGPGMAISFLTLIYGVLVAYIAFAPLATSFRRRLEEAESAA